MFLGIKKNIIRLSNIIKMPFRRTKIIAKLITIWVQSIEINKNSQKPDNVF